MKPTYLTFILLFSYVLIHAQTTAIPDTNFEQELINQGIDSNGLNGNILDTDAQSVVDLTLSGNTITDITGINAFVNVTNLDLGNNQVVNVAPTSLTQLISFRTNDNELLASVDFTQNTLLEDVFIHGNFPNTQLPPITLIDLSQNLNLISFDGDFLNNVTNLIWPITNTLTTIDIRYLADTTLDFSQLSGLENLEIGGSAVNNVSITLPNVFTSLTDLKIYSIDIPTIDISNYINLENLLLWGTYVENLVLPNSTTLTDIFIILHDIQNPLDFSILPNLVDLDITSNQTTPLVVDVTQNLLLEDVDLSRNDLNTIDLTQNIILEQLTLNDNNLTALNVTQNILLNRLSARDNQLTTLDLTQNTILEYLTLSNNLIPNLDVTQNVILRSLTIDNNLFTGTGLDLTQNVELSFLNISYNQVESLYILDCVKLSSLIASHNLFLGIDLLDQLYIVKSNYFGVTASNIIDVSFNNLSGPIPDFASLVGTNANYFRFYFNNNAFEFGHFEDQHNQLVDFLSQTNTFGSSELPIMTQYWYAPQEKVDTIETINTNAGDSVTLTTICAGSQNHYTWFKDGVAIPGAPDSPNYTIDSVNSCDQAVYHSEITSDLVPFDNANPPGTNGKNLLLIRNDITLNVTSPTESCTSLISPINGSTNVPLNEVLTWAESLGACGYFISIGSTSGGTDIINNQDIGNVTSFTPTTDLPPNTQVFVTITPYFFNGAVLSCSEESFTTGNTTIIPECTSLTFPLTGEIDVSVSATIYWNAIANATGYNINAGTTPSGTSLLNNVDVGLIASYDFTNDFPENTTIYITIIPYNNAGNALSCFEESFTTISNCNMGIPPTTECWETATFNNTTCVWEVTGTQPTQPTVECWETATFNNTTCTWDITGTQPTQPTLECWETATFNNATCVWDITGTQPTQPTIECWETATFNNTICVWDITGTQPTQPTLECWETATFNNTTCIWDVTGTQPTQPTLECWETATFNNTTCVWDVTGTQPTQPNLECWETATFNNTTCTWEVTGTQPTQPPLECWETATFNNTTCVWDVTGTQPTQPTIECWETATFNNTTCTWDITGTQPMFDLTDSNLEIVEQHLTVTIQNTSINYEYSIDGVFYQTDNEFFDIPEGNYTLFVRDETNCVEKTIPFEISLIKFNIPRFFTPNNDSFNDYWKVLDLDNIINSIHIFDRYGKLLTIINPNSRGWDGTFKGRLLKNDDYWYVITLKSSKSIKGHFSLKR